MIRVNIKKTNPFFEESVRGENALAKQRMAKYFSIILNTKKDIVEKLKQTAKS